jgi:hypothetical protein
VASVGWQKRAALCPRQCQRKLQVSRGRASLWPPYSLASIRGQEFRIRVTCNDLTIRIVRLNLRPPVFARSNDLNACALGHHHNDIACKVGTRSKIKICRVDDCIKLISIWARAKRRIVRGLRNFSAGAKCLRRHCRLLWGDYRVLVAQCVRETIKKRNKDEAVEGNRGDNRAGEIAKHCTGREGAAIFSTGAKSRKSQKFKQNESRKVDQNGSFQANYGYHSAPRRREFNSGYCSIHS